MSRPLPYLFVPGDFSKSLIPEKEEKCEEEISISSLFIHPQKIEEPPKKLQEEKTELSFLDILIPTEGVMKTAKLFQQQRLEIDDEMEIEKPTSSKSTKKNEPLNEALLLKDLLMDCNFDDGDIELDEDDEYISNPAKFSHVLSQKNTQVKEDSDSEFEYEEEVISKKNIHEIESEELDDFEVQIDDYDDEIDGDNVLTLTEEDVLDGLGIDVKMSPKGSKFFAGEKWEKSPNPNAIPNPFK